jgi:hypothetical protein
MGGTDDPERPACGHHLKNDGDTFWCVEMAPDLEIEYPSDVLSPTATPSR